MFMNKPSMDSIHLSFDVQKHMYHIKRPVNSKEAFVSIKFMPTYQLHGEDDDIHSILYTWTLISWHFEHATSIQLCYKTKRDFPKKNQLPFSLVFFLNFWLSNATTYQQLLLLFATPVFMSHFYYILSMHWFFNQYRSAITTISGISLVWLLSSCDRYTNMMCASIDLQVSRLFTVGCLFGYWWNEMVSCIAYASSTKVAADILSET